MEFDGGRLRHIHSHDTITLLCHSFATPKLIHILLSALCYASSFLHKYDHLLGTILSNITNIHFDDFMVADFPPNQCGVAIRSVVHLALSAFQASADGSHDLINHLLPPRLHNSPYSEVEEGLGLALGKWP